MTTCPRDTAPEAWSTHAALLDQMGGPARVRIAVELSEAFREIRMSGIRARNPGLDEREALARLVWEDYGVELPPAS
jgi:hypothetical protein